MRSIAPCAVAVFLALSVAGCAGAPATTPGASPGNTAGSSSGSDAGSDSSNAPGDFPGQTRADYQLGGAYPPPPGVGIVVRDSTAAAEPGLWSVCYVNGFQTQPGEAQRWDTDLLLHADGAVVVDPAWPDEYVLDTGTASARERIAAVIDADLTRCAEAGFDAVEIDNLDTFARFPALSFDDAVDLAGRYADRAHELGMLIGQKNAAEAAARLHDEVGFDFAVAEECVAFGECAEFSDVYGDAVLDIEYADDPRVTAPSVCADPDRPFATVYRDRDLVPAGSPGYVFEAC